MSSAQDFQVSFSYGATSAPYSQASPHRGDDRPCPSGTPIVIAGTTVALTGNTGKSTGPHLHTQEWNGTYSNTRKPQNAFKPGTVTNIDPNGTQGDGSFGKFVTIQTADGWNDTYCHLSEIKVQKGQVLGMASNEAIELAFQLGFNRSATQGEQDYWKDYPIEKLERSIYNDPDNDKFRYKAVNYDKDIAAAKQGKFKKYDGPQLFVEDK